MKRTRKYVSVFLTCLGLLGSVGFGPNLFPDSHSAQAATAAEFVSVPPFISFGAPPLVMLVMARDHKLYYEAYNDASDLDGDGKLDIYYTPSIDYYGYFDSYKCYAYNTSEKLFEPKSVTSDKKCVGSAGDYWSGDYLNYLTMARMDTVRKVLYGGYRSTDTTQETILERVYVPQDAHSWGKEYTSVEVDGYDIADYTPFTRPTPGRRHLFGSTTLNSGDAIKPPLLRYILNNSKRNWEWSASEGPVLKTSTVSGSAAAQAHPGHPDNHAAYEYMVTNFAVPFYLKGTLDWKDFLYNTNPTYKPNGQLTRSSQGAIDGAGNPFGANYKPYDSAAADQDNYMAVFTGEFKVTNGAGTYCFGTTGDDATEVIIDQGTADEIISGHYGGHGPASSPVSPVCRTYTNNSVHSIEFRFEEAAGGDQYYLYWRTPASSTYQIMPLSTFNQLSASFYSLGGPGGTLVDQEVRVKVCDPTIGLEPNCKQYPDGNYKPIGILQRHGETGKMYFGLMTGSYTHNTQGGVLRKNISDIRDEINTNNGTFKASPGNSPHPEGIVYTINQLKIVDWNGTNPTSGGSYSANCGWIVNGPMGDGQCRDWGNPIAEMMYETLRYFAGLKTPTPSYNYTDTKDYTLPLPKPAWIDPYDKAAGGFDSCSKPFMLVLSDINPNFDTNALPGVSTLFPPDGSLNLGAVLPGFNASTLSNIISDKEDLTGNKYIGQSGLTNDGICSAKGVASFATIRGLCPEEPTKKGGYYSAAVAYHGHITDLNLEKEDDQKVTTYGVGLASPLPRIEFRLGPNKKLITLVPFGKTVSNSANPPPHWPYHPTNTIVDFFVEEISPTHGKFRINYEDVEQGADHDMDAITSYEYWLVDNQNTPVSDPAQATQVKIALQALYASGGYIQHTGYIISGTTADGPYLEIRDIDTPEANDRIYPEDTPAEDWNRSAKNFMPLTATRTFRPANDNSNVADLLENPLWYAAKWGGFEDRNGNNLPDRLEEWDSDLDGDPDNYFYVINPLKLEEQLNKSFASILNRASSGTSATVVTNSRSGEGAVYQSLFYPERSDSTGGSNVVTWIGQVHAFLVDGNGNMREDTHKNGRLDVVPRDQYNVEQPIHQDLTSSVDQDYLDLLDAILVFKDGKFDRFYDVNANGILDKDEETYHAAGTVSSEQVKYLWNSSDWLNSINDGDVIKQRSPYLSKDKERYIFTWVDANDDGIPDSGEVQDFIWPTTMPSDAELANPTAFYPYLHLYPSFADRPAWVTTLQGSLGSFRSFLQSQTERQINWIRGLDYVDVSGTPQPLELGNVALPGTEMRSRRYNNGTWRLGDIAYSTPTSVGAPAEAYHLLYKDKTYQPFYSEYRNRRNVVYVGANDGMLHAFNGGFYDSFTSQFCREPNPDYHPLDADYAGQLPCVADDISTYPALGAELWAYVPYNLLSHLYWLTEPDYEHIYYVDQKPKAFDVKIFLPDSVHINGWGTILVVGMRLGGAAINADIHKTAGNNAPAVDDPTMRSAVMIFDITNPETPPQLMAEFAMPKMGFSTSVPTLVVRKDGDRNKAYGDYNSLSPYLGENRWYLTFGSGPADSNGLPSVEALHTFASTQQAEMYMVDLSALGLANKLRSINEEGETVDGLHPCVVLAENNSFVSDPASVAYKLDFNTDVVYYGTISGSRPIIGDETNTGWRGNLRRMVMKHKTTGEDTDDPADWLMDSILLDAQQPVSSAPVVTIDDDRRNWVFFGTGRYFTPEDVLDRSMQSFYGIKEPIENGQNTWETVLKTNLVDVTEYIVTTGAGGRVQKGSAPGSSIVSWSTIINEQKGHSGWRLNFLEPNPLDQNKKTIKLGERNLSQASLIGGVLAFTTFIPTADACVAGGEGFLHALYYKTGTAYYRPILTTTVINVDGQNDSISNPRISLGEGVPSDANLQTNAEGTQALIQTSKGDIIPVDIEPPHPSKSGRYLWKER